MDEQPYDYRHAPSTSETEQRAEYRQMKEQRATRQRDEASMARRAKALELAVRAEVPTITGATLGRIFETATLFLTYIEDGTQAS